VRALADTHVLLWWLADDATLATVDERLAAYDVCTI
jgi:PIN domain nuclease of toxin-antitoxin system